MDTQCNYTFQDKKTNINIITQTWKEFYKLQTNKNYIQLDYQRLGTRGIPYWKTDFKFVEEMNNFYRNLKPFKKCGNIHISIPDSGIYNQLRIMLKFFMNHAAMCGDKELYNRARDLDKNYWYNGPIYQFALPAHK